MSDDKIIYENLPLNNDKIRTYINKYGLIGYNDVGLRYKENNNTELDIFDRSTPSKNYDLAFIKYDQIDNPLINISNNTNVGIEGILSQKKYCDGSSTMIRMTGLYGITATISAAWISRSVHC